jgi:very-short-patch-repair endonuclease
MFIERWFQLMLERCDQDIAGLEELDFFDQLALRAKWSKETDLLCATLTAMQKYDSEAGKIELIMQVFGDQLGLPAESIPADIEQRIDWYKKRLAVEYERSLKRELNLHTITSPIEQIFLMEWRFLRVDERYGVKLRPQDTLKVDGIAYSIDFVVQKPDGKMKLAIELDGHDFHEKTKEQATRDRRRERAIIRHGFTILRFTGSEIFRNSRKCVEEVIEMITL